LAATDTGADALDRAGDLLEPEHASAARRAGPGPGYLDLIGGDLPSTGRTQDLMLTSIVPKVYENYWRPALGRVAKGVTGPGMDEEVRIARLLMGLSPGDVVLDVACGPGNFSREFARAVGARGLVVGIDASRTMLDRGAADLERFELDNLALVRGNAVELPFRDGSFDGLCCFAALHLFDEPLAALGEMARVLAPGGRIALMTSVRRQLTLLPLKPLIERASGMRVFEADEIVTALRMRGFREIHQRLSGMVQFVGGRLPERTAPGGSSE
jgi:ubiquinone/menaquinone biosynthesis C-methylase UbiE